MWIELVMDDHTQYRKYHPQLKEELLVGTADRRNVNYIAVAHVTINHNNNINSYLFDKGQLSSMNSDPLHPQHEYSFKELGKQVPQLRESLESCVKLLL